MPEGVILKVEQAEPKKPKKKKKKNWELPNSTNS